MGKMKGRRTEMNSNEPKLMMENENSLAYFLTSVGLKVVSKNVFTRGCIGVYIGLLKRMN